MDKYLDYSGVSQLWERICEKISGDIETAIDLLVDGAPNDLNTLNELAVAIDNDPDFYYNVYAAINEKYTLPDTGMPEDDMDSYAQSDLSKARSSLQGLKVNGVLIAPDDNNIVDIDIREDAHDYSKDYLTFEVLESGTTFSFTTNNLQYSLDNGTTWSTLTSGSSTPSLDVGDKILWKQTGLTPTSSSGIGRFSSTGNFNAEGNVMSLYYGDSFETETNLTGKDYAFRSLFYNCTKLVSARNLILSPSILSDHCYQTMFYGCSSLSQAPKVQATTLTSYCYVQMFQGCSSLISAPELPSTSLAGYCYRGMFVLCTSLIEAPKLNATTLSNYCYYQMFWGCSSLRIAPELAATTLAEGCYRDMFDSCTLLTVTPDLPATTLASGCYTYMFYNCTGLTTAKLFPAQTLTTDCYKEMFYGCSSLNYIKCLATDISATGCTSGWVHNVAASGKFIKDDSMTSWTVGENGIPTGWVVYQSSKDYDVMGYDLADVATTGDYDDLTNKPTIPQIIFRQW